MATLNERIDDVERRLTALELRGPPGVEGPAGEDPPALDGQRWWLLEHLSGATGSDADGVGGAVALGGRVGLPDGRRYAYQVEHPAGAVLAADLDPAAAVLAALGHPVRLQILRALLLGTSTLAELSALPDIGTSGQVNHHLRTLRSGGLVESTRRNHWAVVGGRVVVVLVVLAAVLGPMAISTSEQPDADSSSTDPVPTPQEYSA